MQLWNILNKEELMIELSLDNEQFKEKPSSSKTSSISRRIAKQHKTIGFKQFALALSNGQTWSAVFTDGKRTASNWAKQSLFAVDIDQGIKSVELITDLCQRECLDPFIIHHSFSSRPEAIKLRIIFKTSEPIEDAMLALQIQTKLTEIFGGDSCVIDLARLFYGGKKQCLILFEPDAELDLAELEPLPELVKQKTIGDIKLYDSATSKKAQAELLAELKKKNSGRYKLVCQVLNEQYERVSNVAESSRYESVFKSAVRLAQFKELLPSIITDLIKGAVESSSAYDSWDKKTKLDKIIGDALVFGRLHLYE
jgi:hypothetical protein